MSGNFMVDELFIVFSMCEDSMSGNSLSVDLMSGMFRLYTFTRLVIFH